MAKKIELSRVNMNLPLPLVEKVKDYAKEMGLNVTSAYIILLNCGLRFDKFNKKTDDHK